MNDSQPTAKLDPPLIGPSSIDPTSIDPNSARPTAARPGAGSEGAAPRGAAPDERRTRPKPRSLADAVVEELDNARAVRRRRRADGADEAVLPDFCNLGIGLRTVVSLNCVALLAALVGSISVADALSRFAAVAVLLEPVALGSVVCLCALRRVLNGQPGGVQWAVGVAVPVLLTVAVASVSHGMLVSETQAGSAFYWVAVRALAAAVAAAVIIEAFRWRARAFSPSLTEARLHALQARIRPHFLFNSLNTVLGLMRSHPRRAEMTLENLADLFRVFMRDTRELVSLEEELVICQQYLAIEQLRLGERLHVVWEVEQMPGDALLPSLLLQPLIENSVIHGIEQRSEPGEITIHINQVADRVRVQIVNPANHEQVPARVGNHMALSNIRERLMLLYDMEAELKTAEDGDQFRLFLEFPYRKERRKRDVRRHFNPDR